MAAMMNLDVLYNLGDPNETFILVGQTNSDYVFYYWQKSILRVGEIVSESER